MTKNYITSGTHYSEQVAPDRTYWLRVDFRAFEDNGSHELELRIYTTDFPDGKETHFEGRLGELIELILLGKTYKAQLVKETKTNEVLS